MCCFDLQQSLEFTLKYLVECSGEPYKFGHNILTQLADFERLHVEIPGADFFKQNAPVINTWESQLYSNDEFTVDVQLVASVMTKVLALIEFADQLAIPITGEMNSFN